MNIEEAKECRRLLMNCMVWQETPQGFDFWAAAYNRLGDNIVSAEKEAADNYDGAPYCSYGHKTQASCDCGPIADNN